MNDGTDLTSPEPITGDPYANRRLRIGHLDAETTADLAGTAEGFARLALKLHEACGVEQIIRAVVEFALRTLNCDYAGVMLHTADRPEPSVLVDPTQRGQCAPEWAQNAFELAVRCVLEVPLCSGTGTGTVGVLCLYSTEVEAFGPHEEAIAQVLARHAAIALASAQHEQNLWDEVDTRRLVGQAMGILMERHSLNSDEASQVLNRYAQETDTVPGDVARQVIDSLHRPTT
jgi:GAF domain-containing protein